jgi:hypothetical protein
MDLPASLGGARVTASVAHLGAAVPSDPRELRLAVAELLAERAIAEIRASENSEP